MNNITIELCAEDRARIDNLTAALLKIADAAYPATPEQVRRMIGSAEPAIEAPKPKKEAPKAELKPEPVAEAPKAEPTPAPTPEPVKEGAQATEPAKEVTVDELRAKVMQLINAGKKDATRAIITSYAPNVTEIPADKRAEVLKKLNELEG